MKIFHDDADFDAQLQRTLTGAYCGSADLGEAFATAARVAPGDYDGWHREWQAAAGRARDAGAAAESKGRRDLAVAGHLRAAEYERQSWFFLRHDLGDERVERGFRAQRDDFHAALRLLLWPADPIRLEQGRPGAPPVLEGYLFRPTDDELPRPTVVLPCNVDSTAEEGWKLGARAAVELGFNVVVVAGPGQGELLFVHGVPLRPDYEAVVTPLVDWLVDEPYVEPGAITLVGRGLGGYLAPRAASAERRVAALVADPGQLDVASRIRPRFSDDDWQRLLDADPALDAALEHHLDAPRERERWGSFMAAMGATTLGGLIRAALAYSLDGRAEEIGCPTLVTEAEGDRTGQSRQLYDALTCEKAFHHFPAADGVGGPAGGVGQRAWQQVVLGWLLDVTSRG